VQARPALQVERGPAAADDVVGQRDIGRLVRLAVVAQLDRRGLVADEGVEAGLAGQPDPAADDVGKRVLWILDI
jgi:hypothetical protein